MSQGPPVSSKRSEGSAVRTPGANGASARDRMGPVASFACRVGVKQPGIGESASKGENVGVPQVADLRTFKQKPGKHREYGGKVGGTFTGEWNVQMREWPKLCLMCLSQQVCGVRMWLHWWAMCFAHFAKLPTSPMLVADEGVCTWQQTHGRRRSSLNTGSIQVTSAKAKS